ncbi:propionyl-CoA carboxylase [mine drainage metagenome]|uniref:Propionyl-CoA carboxylase n=1 Tax=mine drainage metagenome TaxID=410659 RepID=T1CUA2_9ZZZZ
MVFMVEGNASMYLGSPRMAQEVVGERVSLEEMGGARMHCSVSGCGDMLCPDEETAITALRGYLGYFPSNWGQDPPAAAPRHPGSGADIGALLPEEAARGYDIHEVLEALVDAGSFFEIKALYARELVCGLARSGGQGRWAWSPLSRPTREASCSLTPPTRRPASSASATPSTCP